jgi:CBS-domain-containing membrane protein
MKLWRVDDVMTKDVVAVRLGTRYQDLVKLLIERKVSAVPVVDRFGYVLGVVSEADLLPKVTSPVDKKARIFATRRWRAERTKAKGITARDVMTAPAVCVLPSISVAAAAQRMQDKNVKRLPVEDDLGRLVGIVTRSDLLKAQLRPDMDIQRDVTDEVLWQDLALEPDTVDATTVDGIVTLVGRTRCRSITERAVRLARRVPGVIDVVDMMTYDIDDLAIFRIKSATPAGVA